MRKAKTGPARDYKMVAEVVKLRRKGLSYKKIAKELDKDVKTVYRWATYAVGELSTQASV